MGKAKNLRSRLNTYFANPAEPAAQDLRDGAYRGQRGMDVVGSELEALQLEYTWIKEFTPRFNIMFRDDKTYPYLAVTMGEKYPRVQVMRGERRKGDPVLRPLHRRRIRETMDTLLRVFPVRSCSAGVLKRAQRSGRPCLLGYIDKCSAPCVGRISRGGPPGAGRGLLRLHGRGSRPFIRRLEREMAAAVAELDYERAARLRDDIVALEQGLRTQRRGARPKTPTPTSSPWHEDELEAAVQVFHVRGGRIRGQRGWVVEKVEDATTAGPGRTPAAAGLRRGGRQPGQVARARSWCPRRPATPPSCAMARRPARRPGWTSACPSAETRPP